MLIKNILLFLIISFNVNARERIRGMGTPLLFPIFATIADEISYSKNIPSPFIEISATGFAFQIFCSGTGDNYPDLVNSSRLISPKEIDLCKANNINFKKIDLAYDAVVMVTNKNSGIKNLTDEQLFKAISEYVFDENGYLIKNKYHTWQDIYKHLPNDKIIIYGTTITSGTYDFLKEKIFAPQCSKTKSDDKLKKFCGVARQDGQYVPVPGGYTLNIQKMSSRPGAVAMISYLFLEKHYTRFSIISINDITPNDQNIKEYILSRLLFVYYKQNSIDDFPIFKDFIEELKKRSISYD